MKSLKNDKETSQNRFYPNLLSYVCVIREIDVQMVQMQCLKWRERVEIKLRNENVVSFFPLIQNTYGVYVTKHLSETLNDKIQIRNR